MCVLVQPATIRKATHSRNAFVFMRLFYSLLAIAARHLLIHAPTVADSRKYVQESLMTYWSHPLPSGNQKRF
jgi:hypothetical protein